MPELNVFTSPSVGSFFSLNKVTRAKTCKKSSAQQIVPDQGWLQEGIHPVPVYSSSFCLENVKILKHISLPPLHFEMLKQNVSNSAHVWVARLPSLCWAIPDCLEHSTRSFKTLHYNNQIFAPTGQPVWPKCFSAFQYNAK